MEKKTSKKTEVEKREVRLLDVKKRDRGDVKKQENMKSKADGASQKALRKVMVADRGDIGHKIPVTSKLDKHISEKNKKNNEPKRKPQSLLNPKLNPTHNRPDKTKSKDNNKNEIKSTSMITDVTFKVDTAAGDSKIETKDAFKGVGVRKSDKVNLKGILRSSLTQSVIAEVVNRNAPVSDLKSDRSRNEPSVKSASKAKLADSSNKSDSTKTDGSSKKETQVRKPTIKTVRSKNDGRIYKAVTFTDQKHVKPTALEINMPNVQVKKSKIPKLIDKSPQIKIKPAPSKVSVKECKPPARRHRLSGRYKRKRLNRHVASPDKFKRMESPPTEVAKWAPCCVNRHTKPYYEAWVNTTLAAISKLSKKDKLFLEKQNLIKTFQRSLERPESPELVHENYADETYTGKIKIIQKVKNAAKRNKQHPVIGPLLDQFAL